jgi:small subunit ribosomal protein S1
VHVSELSWSRRVKSPTRLFSIGQPLEAIVLNIQPQERRISLGVRQLRPDPWTTLVETCSVGSVVQGTVRNLTDFGAFVEVAEGVDGLIHVSDLCWARKIKHPSEVLRKGQQVGALVLHVDPVNHRLSLGMKQLQPDAWKAFFSAHNVGETIQGKVTRSTSFGLFVELEGGIEGLCHRSQRDLKLVRKLCRLGRSAISRSSGCSHRRKRSGSV